MNIETIREDVSEDTGITQDDASKIFLKNWMKAAPKELADADEDEAEGQELPETEDDDQDDSDETQVDQDDDEVEDDGTDPETAEDNEDDKEKLPAKIAEDDAIVTYTVDGEEKQVSVKDLRRLAGQEASLTQKSQAVAAKFKKAEEAEQIHAHAVNAMLNKAADRFKPYAEIDYLVAQQRMKPEDFAQLRADAKAAHDEYLFIDQEVKQYTTKKDAQIAADTAAAAEVCKTALTDPKNASYIEGWDEKLYDTLRSYAVTNGADADGVNRMTDPVSFKVLHKAYLYDQTKVVAAKKKAGITPKKVLKDTKVSAPSGKPKATAALAKLRKSGSQEDAAAAFMAGWGIEEK